MEPIINPWLIYLIQFVTSLKLLVFPVFGLSAIFSLGMLIEICQSQMKDDEDIFHNCLSFGYSKEEAERRQHVAIKREADKMKVKVKWFKLTFIIFCVSCLLFLLLPTKEAMLTMLAANYATPDNIHAVQGNIVDFVSQIVNAVNQAGGK